MEDLGARDPPLNARLRRRFPSLVLLALALLAPSVIELASQTPSPTPLTMLSRDGRRAIPLALVNNQEFVAVDDLAAIFQLSVREDALGALTITYKDKTIVLTNQALASVGGPARLAPRAGGPCRPPLARAGRIHRPGAGARVRHRSWSSASRRTC